MADSDDEWYGGKEYLVGATYKEKKITRNISHTENYTIFFTDDELHWAYGDINQELALIAEEKTARALSRIKKVFPEKDASSQAKEVLARTLDIAFSSSSSKRILDLFNNADDQIFFTVKECLKMAYLKTITLVMMIGGIFGIYSHLHSQYFIHSTYYLAGVDLPPGFWSNPMLVSCTI